VTWGIVPREKFKLVCGTLRRVSYAGRLRGFAAFFLRIHPTGQPWMLL